MSPRAITIIRQRIKVRILLRIPARLNQIRRITNDNLWEAKGHFSVKVPGTTSRGILQKQAGEVINGMWLYPYMNIEQYVQNIVFGQFAANEFKNPRILGQAQPADLTPNGLHELQRRRGNAVSNTTKLFET